MLIQPWVKEFFESNMAHDLRISRYDFLSLTYYAHLNYTNFESESYTSFANFTFQEFESHEALEDYVRSDTYGD